MKDSESESSHAESESESELDSNAETNESKEKKPQSPCCVPMTEACSPPRPDSSLAKALDVATVGCLSQSGKSRSAGDHKGAFQTNENAVSVE